MTSLPSPGERREEILALLQASRAPIPARDLAARFGVSRQVIVQDVAVLRAAGHPILATAAGYLGPQISSSRPYRAVLAVRHTREQTEDELLALVGAGVRVVDVVVDHPIYGELRGLLMLETRDDVKRFMDRVNAERVSLLSSLTGGLHLHTIEAAHPEQLNRARAAMAERDYLVTDGTADPEGA